jgi:hypothetical protein
MQNTVFDTCKERRSGRDRRVRRISNVIWLFRRGRRRNLRRDADRHSLHLMDYYSPDIFYVLVLVLLLSVADALLTLWLLDSGAVELNPVMAYFIDMGENAFMSAKYFLTAFAVVIVVILHYAFVRYSRLRLAALLHLFACCFGAVVAWELVLMVRFVL